MNDFIGRLAVVIAIGLVVYACLDLFVLPAVNWVAELIESFFSFALTFVGAVLLAGAVLGGFTYMFHLPRLYSVTSGQVGYFKNYPHKPYVGPTTVRESAYWGLRPPKEFRVLDLTEKMHPVITNYGPLVLTWSLDPVRIVQYLSAGEESGVRSKIAELLAHDPSLDLATVGPRLGVVFVDPPKIGPPADPDIFDPTVAMAALQPMLLSVDQIESARRTFFATYAELLSDPSLHARATRFFDDLLAKALRVR